MAEIEGWAEHLRMLQRAGARDQLKRHIKAAENMDWGKLEPQKSRLIASAKAR
jgi:hypothetical protein